MSDRVNKFRKWSLALAEVVDSWRMVPRVIVAGYAWLVGYMIWYFLKFETVAKVHCDAGVLKVLLDNKETVENAKMIACQTVELLGPPTTVTALVGVVVGASAAVFGLYANSGKKWSADFTKWNGEDKQPPKKAKPSEQKQTGQKASKPETPTKPAGDQPVTVRPVTKGK